jgi:CDP-6-deoxy-D-xylo-4-hexulose-3-dehydrase
MTTGEGGAVASDDGTWSRALVSLREWGRDCWCPPGRDDVCGRRFQGRFGGLPEGFDHKYVFSQAGYNFKLTDLQAAIGVAQTERLGAFADRRRANYARLRAALEPYADQLILPRTLEGADALWFGFPITLREGAARPLQLHLLRRRVANRVLLGGNLTLQPGFRHLEHRVAAPLPHADRITEAAIWVGCGPRVDDAMADWTAESVAAFLKIA